MITPPLGLFSQDENVMAATAKIEALLADEPLPEWQKVGVVTVVLQKLVVANESELCGRSIKWTQQWLTHTQRWLTKIKRKEREQFNEQQPRTGDDVAAKELPH
jgi:hypothetical protein